MAIHLLEHSIRTKIQIGAFVFLCLFVCVNVYRISNEVIDDYILKTESNLAFLGE